MIHDPATLAPDARSTWRTLLNIVLAALGLLALAGLSMVVILLVARMIDWLESSPARRPVPATVQTAVPPAEQNARTRAPQPYDLQPWPDSPARRVASNRMSGSSAHAGMAGDAGSPASPSGPVGVSLDAYRAAVAAGKTFYLPNPKGACDLSGANLEKSTQALDECFASRAAP